MHPVTWNTDRFEGVARHVIARSPLAITASRVERDQVIDDEAPALAEHLAACAADWVEDRRAELRQQAAA